MYRVRQRLEQTQLTDIPGAVSAALEEAGVLAAIKPGMKIVITAGSRGIANIPVILRAAVDAVRARGGAPTVLPTMGSHGGATPEGQIEVLRSLGVTEQSVGAPIISSLETIQLGQTPRASPSTGPPTPRRPTASWSSGGSSRTRISAAPWRAGWPR